MSLSLLDWIELLTSDNFDVGTKEELGKLKRKADMLRRNYGTNDASYQEVERQLAEFVHNMQLAGGYDALG